MHGPGLLGSIHFASEAIGPLITFAVWVTIFVVRSMRGRAVYVAESLAVIGCLVSLQLLLDLHTRYLGDIVIAALHLVYFGAIVFEALRDRIRCARARRGDHE